MYQIERISGIDVYFTDELDGGGRTYGQDYIQFVERHFGQVGRVFEWCSGPGFIGFALLGLGLCESLCLADINPEAVAACQQTVKANGLEDKVDLYVSDSLSNIPPSEQWDLVVGNPPHSGTTELHPKWGPPILYMDIDWRLHERFYSKVARSLRPGGSVVSIEGVRESSLESFRGMIERGGLTVFRTETCARNPYYYYIWSRIESSCLGGEIM